MSLIEAMTMPHPAKLSVADFLLLDSSGAFDAYAKTELVNGAIIVVNAQYSEHLTAKVTLLRRLANACDALGLGLEAWSEGSIDMGPDSMPEPDLFITDQRPVSGPVRRDTVRLIAEVSDSTQAYDLGEKAALYARQAIAEYWVVDLKAREVVQMAAPAGEAYADLRRVALGQAVQALTIPGLAIETRDI